MKTLKLSSLIILFLSISSLACFAQEIESPKQGLEKEKFNNQAKTDLKSNFELYNTYFSFKNYELNNSDLELINLIDFNTLEPYRLIDQDVEIFLPEIDKTIILFSKSKVKEYKINNQKVK